MRKSRVILWFLASCLFLHILVAAGCKTSGGIVTGNTKDSSASIKRAYEKLSLELGVSLDGKEDRKLLTEIAGWLGVKYKYGGADKSGTDCSGLTSSIIQGVYNIGLYRRSVDQIRNTNNVDRKELSCGDLVFFKIKQNKISHVGLYIADNKFVHASVKRGVVINDLDETYYAKYYCCAGRIKQLDLRK